MICYFCSHKQQKISIMIGKNSGIKYKGGWQKGSVISQILEGPIGNGVVDYSNGDRFEGFFHLNYAHIHGPAYAAEGRYQFADGSVIEHAWINTSEDLEVMDLIGVYRVKHTKGPDTITPFYCHKRSGIEVVLAETPYAIEWYEDEQLQELAMKSYNFEQLDEDRSVLTVVLKDGTVITQRGGKLEENQYDNLVFDTCLYDSIQYPDGSSIDFYGYDVKYLKPFDGWFTIHETNGKYHQEVWKEGQLEQLQDEKWDETAAKTIELPDPFDKSYMRKAMVWEGHINYSYGTWIYDGEMRDDRPDGYGVLVGDDVDTKGRRYEGEFKDGLCHGAGTFTYHEGGIEQSGEWVEGVFQEKDAPSSPIMLKVVLSGDDSDEQMVEAKVGSFPFFMGFGGLRIDRIEKGCITFSDYGTIYLLTPGDTLYLHHEIEGREWSDGCVYDSEDYYLRIIWRRRYS
jgi:hypothetical protein